MKAITKCHAKKINTHSGCAFGEKNINVSDEMKAASKHYQSEEGIHEKEEKNTVRNYRNEY